jgi:hypothetical protein
MLISPSPCHILLLLTSRHMLHRGIEFFDGLDSMERIFDPESCICIVTYLWTDTSSRRANAVAPNCCTAFCVESKGFVPLFLVTFYCCRLHTACYT